MGVTKSEGGGSEENNNAGSCIGALLVTSRVPQGSLFTFLLLLSTVAYNGGGSCVVVAVLSPHGSEKSAIIWYSNTITSNTLEMQQYTIWVYRYIATCVSYDTIKCELTDF